jgi:CBS domain-containing protein
MKISNILATKGIVVYTIRPSQTAHNAVALLARHNIGALVVVDDEGRPVGIISERDIVRALVRGDDVLTKTVDQVMTKTVISALPQDDIQSVMQTMTDKRFRHLPVVEQGKLSGIVSIGDVIKALLAEYRGEIDTLQTQISQG